MLDERLTLAMDLYDSCDLAADIGTDHACLPAALLQAGRCRRMILTDLSEKALENGRRLIVRRRLEERAEFRLGNGLEPIREVCGVISVMGMGGRTIRSILLSGRSRLRGAVLILSAHTDLPLVRSALNEIGYSLSQEEPCFCGGRFYLVIRAVPGGSPLTEQEIRLGGPLFRSSSPVLLPYLQRRKEILLRQLSGLRSASDPSRILIRQAEEDLAVYQQQIRRFSS